MEDVDQTTDSSKGEAILTRDPIIKFEKEILDSYGIDPSNYKEAEDGLVFNIELSDEAGETNLEFTLDKNSLIVVPYDIDLSKQEGPEFEYLKIGEGQDPNELTGKGNFLLFVNNFKLKSNGESVTMQNLLQEFSFEQELTYVLGRPRYSSPRYHPKIKVVETPLPQSIHDLVGISHEVGHALHQSDEPDLYDDKVVEEDNLKASVKRERSAWAYTDRMLRKLRDLKVSRFNFKKIKEYGDFYLHHGYEEKKNVAETLATSELGHHFSGKSRGLFKKKQS